MTLWRTFIDTFIDFEITVFDIEVNLKLIL